MSLNPIASACRSCRYYTPEGRRGGNCQQLGAPVRGSWQACSLAIPAFAPSGENFAEMMIWRQEIIALQEMLPADSSLKGLLFNTSELETAPIQKTAKAETLSV